ncbi:hypothetical protein BCR34DRAFT_346879 [Clohesyomyces aquaticus]|uniref:Uncharacterized protein n=1 Tax=Clohesyomyces aquaticus TaxID=1231657 RepID=A0A1Y1ZK41_9PLEO|nr:hypothetical protein BCR34DRAFT_346879 [Clohesyomyces aquaticus]
MPTMACPRDWPAARPLVCLVGPHKRAGSQLSLEAHAHLKLHPPYHVLIHVNRSLRSVVAVCAASNPSFFILLPLPLLDCFLPLLALIPPRPPTLHSLPSPKEPLLHCKTSVNKPDPPNLTPPTRLSHLHPPPNPSPAIFSDIDVLNLAACCWRHRTTASPPLRHQCSELSPPTLESHSHTRTSFVDTRLMLQSITHPSSESRQL